MQLPISEAEVGSIASGTVQSYMLLPMMWRCYQWEVGPLHSLWYCTSYSQWCGDVTNERSDQYTACGTVQVTLNDVEMLPMRGRTNTQPVVLYKLLSMMWRCYQWEVGPIHSLWYCTSYSQWCGDVTNERSDQYTACGTVQVTLNDVEMLPMRGRTNTQPVVLYMLLSMMWRCYQWEIGPLHSLWYCTSYSQWCGDVTNERSAHYTACGTVQVTLNDVEMLPMRGRPITLPVVLYKLLSMMWRCYQWEVGPIHSLWYCTSYSQWCGDVTNERLAHYTACGTVQVTLNDVEMLPMRDRPITQPVVLYMLLSMMWRCYQWEVGPLHSLWYCTCYSQWCGDVTNERSDQYTACGTVHVTLNDVEMLPMRGRTNTQPVVLYMLLSMMWRCYQWEVGPLHCLWYCTCYSQWCGDVTNERSAHYIACGTVHVTLNDVEMLPMRGRTNTQPVVLYMLLSMMWRCYQWEIGPNTQPVVLYMLLSMMWRCYQW